MESNHLPVSGGLAVVIAVIISYFVINPAALEGIRPAGDGRESSSEYGIEDVQARLWQDPFATVAEYRRKEEGAPQLSGRAEASVEGKDKSASFNLALKFGELGKEGQAKQQDPHSFQSLIDKIYAESKESKAGVNLLAVMVSAGPYPEQAETRLRERYAVTAGLAASGYQPEDEDHIGYVHITNGSECGKRENGTREFGAGNVPAMIPFEWFKNQEEGSQEKDRYTLLLWLDEDAFHSNPLCKLNFLLQDKIREPLGNLNEKYESIRKAEIIAKAEDALRELSSKKRAEHKDTTPTAQEIKNAYNNATKDTPPARLGRVSMIGPHESTTLKAMLSEFYSDRYKNSPKPFPGLAGVHFYSATATAEPKQLLRSEDIKPFVAGDPVARKFWSKGLTLFRTIANDKELTDKLVYEIRKRLFDRSEQKEKDNFRIALISEWDTLYGRSLPESFASSAYESFPPSPKQANETDKEMQNKKKDWVQKHIYRFSYLRGIDGHVPGQSPAKEGEGEKGKSGNSKEANQNIERPEGRSQKDYLRRLASDIALTDQGLKNEGRKGIRAIGVLGSDVYDKLLILRALRKRFPKAIFFTSDMDAELLQSDQFQWTRNMLVASSYDLKIASYRDILRKLKGGQSSKLKYLKTMLEATARTIPQNRDVYQTAVFLSTILATSPVLISKMESLEKGTASEYLWAKLNSGDANGAKNDTALSIAENDIDRMTEKDYADRLINDSDRSRHTFYQGFGQYIDPRVYEIGRYGAIDLSSIHAWGAENKSINPFYPVPVPSVSPRSVIMVSISAVLFGLLVFLFWRRWWFIRYGVKESPGSQNTRKRAEWVGISVAAISIAVLMLCNWFGCSVHALRWWLFPLYVLNVSTWLWMAYKVMVKQENKPEGKPASEGQS